VNHVQPFRRALWRADRGRRSARSQFARFQLQPGADRFHRRHPKQVGDNLPESLEEVVASYGHHYFKLKVGGKHGAGLARLIEFAALLDRAPQSYFVSLDGNEQYSDIAALLELWRQMQDESRMRRLVASILVIEQPITRAHALDDDVSSLSRVKPDIIDDPTWLDVFPRTRGLGYSGVSNTCRKGANATRCAHWNAEAGAPRDFMTGGLPTQAGLAVRQDLALVNLIGITHVERNGHHYVNGTASLPAAKQARFLNAHPGLCETTHAATRLSISAGELAIASLVGKGLPPVRIRTGNAQADGLVAPLIEVAAEHQGTNFSIRNPALEHPEAAIRMDVFHPADAEHLVGMLDRTGNGFG
jgi:hypothetical protein